MSKRQLLMVLGAWTMIFLFLGFPSTWDKIIAIVTGAVIIAASYRTASLPERSAKEQNRDLPYVDHKSVPVSDITNSTPPLPQ